MIDMEHRLTQVEDRSKSNTKRLDEMEKRQDDLERLATSVEVLANREATVEANVKEIKEDVKCLKEKPAKRWDGLVDKIVWAVCAAVIAFLLGRIGL